MNSIIQKILSEKQREIEELKKRGIRINGTFNQIRDFKKAIRRTNRVNLIAEIKFASPSQGKIRHLENPSHIAKIYEEEGVSAISVITERHFFKGNMDFLREVKQSTKLPVLRKDFIIDPVQIAETVSSGADSVLLISRILDKERLKSLIDIATEYGISVLTEVHDEYDIEKAISCGADIIGINNRDLGTFKVNISNTMKLLTLIPEGCLKVSESGIRGKQDVYTLKQSNIDAMLVGTSIMKSPDIRGKIRELMDAVK